MDNKKDSSQRFPFYQRPVVDSIVPVAMVTPYVSSPDRVVIGYPAHLPPVNGLRDLVIDDGKMETEYQVIEKADTYANDPHYEYVHETHRYYKGYDLDQIEVRRNAQGEPLFDYVNCGYVGFGDKVSSHRGDVWEFGQFGDVNPLFLQIRKSHLQHKIRLESEKKWRNINPDYDDGINFDDISMCIGGVVYKGRAIPHEKIRNHGVVRAPDKGVSGPQIEDESGRKMVFKLDAKGDLNPLYLQLRRRIVVWN